MFYRPEGWAEIRRKNVFRQSATRYDISEMRGAVVESSYSDNSEVYRVSLIVDKGGVRGAIPMTNAYSNIGKHHDVARAINTWLGAFGYRLSVPAGATSASSAWRSASSNASRSSSRHRAFPG